MRGVGKCVSFTLFLIYKTHSFSTFLSLLSLSRNNHGFHIFPSTSSSGRCFLVITSGIRANRGRIVVFLGEKSRFWVKILDLVTVHPRVIELGWLPSQAYAYRVWQLVIELACFFIEFDMCSIELDMCLSSQTLCLSSQHHFYRVRIGVYRVNSLSSQLNFWRVSLSTLSFIE